MEPSSCKQLIIGLPDAGKTTFLAAVWHVVREKDVSGALQLKRMHGLQEHQNNILGKWCNCEKIERTKIPAEKIVSMLLYDPATGETTEIYFPDMSGESFERQWEDRKWTPEYDNLVREATGALVFIHPDKVHEPRLISEVSKAIATIPQYEEYPDPIEKDQAKEWLPKFAPTQVKLVDLLQFLCIQDYLQKPFKIAVIISAWDLISDQTTNPAQWLAERLPLLSQYLKSNPEIFPHRHYGVSAQGGDLEKDKARLLRKMNPTERIVIVGDDCASHDLTAPVKWIMS